MPRGVKKPSAIFRDVLQEAGDKLALLSRKAGGFEHKGIRGDERAGYLAEFLRGHVPGEVGVGKGEAIDFSDARTGQLDLMIYDRSGSAPVNVGQENMLLPCEALYAIIEVKSVVTQDEIDSAYKSAQKLRSLRPFKKQFVGSRTGGASADDLLHRCMYIVFAYDSNVGESDWLSKEFARVKVAGGRAGAPLDCVDRLVVLNRGIINPAAAAGRTTVNGEESVFLELYLHVVNFVSRESRRRPPVDWQMYSSRSTPGWVTLK